MLVIQRRVGESILVTDQIEIQVIESSPSRVKLGIIAPRYVPVFRKEAATTRSQNLRAASPSSKALLQELATLLRTTPPAE